MDCPGHLIDTPTDTLPLYAYHMNAHENGSIVRAFLLKRDANLLAGDVVVRDLAQEQTFNGHQAAMTFFDAYFAVGFAQCEVDVQTLVAGEEDVAVAFIFRGLQHGPFMGIPPTGQQVTIPMVLICQIQSGHISQASFFYNAGTLLRQLCLTCP